MIFKVEVQNIHLPRLAKSMGFVGEQSEFKAFVENWIVERFRENVKAAIVQEKAEAESQDLSDDIKPSV